MPTLLYRGFDSGGKRVSGSGSFASETRLIESLNKREIIGFEVFSSETVFRRGAYSLVSPKELSIFCKQMSVFFYSNIMLMEGISVLEEQTGNKHLKQALKEICEFMEKGYTFADSICMYEHLFPQYLLRMIVIGETSGTLDSIFSRMSSYFDKEHKIRKSMRAAVTYPAILAALMLSVIVLLIVKILPMFGDILESMGAVVPTSARLLLNAGNFIYVYAPVILLIFAAFFFAIAAYTRTEKGSRRTDRFKLTVPAYRYVNSRIAASRFSRSLSILLKSGIQVLSALEDITTITGNTYVEEKLDSVVEKVKNGENLSEALSEIGVFPALFLKLFIIGHKTGNLDEMLEKTADVFDDEADEAIRRFSNMLEPLLIIILSVVVGVILLSVMLPTITIINSIG